MPLTHAPPAASQVLLLLLQEHCHVDGGCLTAGMAPAARPVTAVAAAASDGALLRVEWLMLLGPGLLCPGYYCDLVVVETQPHSTHTHTREGGENKHNSLWPHKHTHLSNEAPNWQVIIVHLEVPVIPHSLCSTPRHTTRNKEC